MWPDMQPWPLRQFGEQVRRFADAAALRSVVEMTLREAWREPERGAYLPRFQSVETGLAFLDSPNAGQYGPRGFKGAGVPQRRRAASVEGMNDDAREQGDDGNAQTDEAALSARLKRLSERLARDQPGRASNGAGEYRATAATGFAKGIQLTSELVAGVLVGGGIGLLIDRWLGSAPWGLVGLTLLGFVAGVVNVIRAAGAASARMSGDARSQNKDG